MDSLIRRGFEMVLFGGREGRPQGSAPLVLGEGGRGERGKASGQCASTPRGGGWGGGGREGLGVVRLWASGKGDWRGVRGGMASGQCASGPRGGGG